MVSLKDLFWTLLFNLYINDLHESVHHSKVIHFANDTSLVITDNSLKQLNQHTNHDLRLITEWLRAN